MCLLYTRMMVNDDGTDKEETTERKGAKVLIKEARWTRG